MLLTSASAEIAPLAPRTVRDVTPCPVLLDLFVAGLARVGSNSDDFFFRRGVFATFCEMFFVDLHLLLLLLSRFVVGRGSMDIETAQPVLSCDAESFTKWVAGTYGSRAGSRVPRHYAP